jgi:hypothetical protein
VTTLLGILKNPEPNSTCPVEPQDLSTYTVLQRPVPLFPVAALGCLVQFKTIPPKLGLTVGANGKYKEHIAQVNVVNRDRCGIEYSERTVDVHENNHKIIWGIPAPERVEVWVLPGCTITFWWLLLQP